MSLDRRVARLNNVLLRELGGNPAISWQHASALTYVAAQFEGDPPKPVLDLYCVCGVNVLVHEPHCRISAPQPHYIHRPMLPDAGDRWVLCVQVPIGDEQAWYRRYGTLIRWPGPAQWQPMSAVNVGSLTLPVGEAPSEAKTSRVIQAINESRMQSARQHTEQSVERFEKGRAKRRTKTEDLVRDCFTAFLNIPGKRGGHASFATATPKGIINKTEPRAIHPKAEQYTRSRYI